MATRKTVLWAFLCLLTPAVAAAQADEVGVTGGVFNFDLSGTGNAPMFAATYDHPLVNESWLMEASVTVAFPGQQFGDRTTVLIPEGLLLYQWSVDRFRPFLGGGVGTAIDFREDRFGGNQVDLTLAGTGGVKILLREGTGIRTELRLRGIGSRFTGTAAEFRIGMFRRF